MLAQVINIAIYHLHCGSARGVVTNGISIKRAEPQRFRRSESHTVSNITYAYTPFICQVWAQPAGLG